MLDLTPLQSEHSSSAALRLVLTDAIMAKADGTEIMMHGDGSMTSYCRDGSVVLVEVSGERTLWLKDGRTITEKPSGVRETLTSEYQMIETPAGIAFKKYHDGIRELRFPNGDAIWSQPDGRVIDKDPRRHQ